MRSTPWEWCKNGLQQIMHISLTLIQNYWIIDGAAVKYARISTSQYTCYDIVNITTVCGHNSLISL